MIGFAMFQTKKIKERILNSALGWSYSCHPIIFEQGLVLECLPLKIYFILFFF